MVEEAAGESSTLDSCLQCGEGQLRVVAAAQGMANHRPDLGRITDPALVWPGHFELALEQIRGHRQSVNALGGEAYLPPVTVDNVRRLHHTGALLLSDHFLTLCLALSLGRSLTGFDLSPSNLPPEGCLSQIQIPRRQGDAPVTSPNQLDRVSLELRRILPSLSLRHVLPQAHYRAKSGVYKNGGTSICFVITKSWSRLIWLDSDKKYS